MKMTWKNQSKKKPNKRPISLFQDENPKDKLAKNEEIPHDDTMKLVESFQEQGNKLAELCETIFTYYKSWAASELLDPSFLFAIDISEKFAVQPMRFVALLKTTRVKEGKYREALGKWESALLLMPDRAILHEQKAQILLELGETWKALKAATRATELEPSWDEAWVTLGRAQLNYGEPDSAIESLDRALAIKPDSAEARNDRQAALHHIQRRKQLQTSGLSMNQNRFAVVDKTESA